MSFMVMIVTSARAVSASVGRHSVTSAQAETVYDQPNAA